MEKNIKMLLCPFQQQQSADGDPHLLRAAGVRQLRGQPGAAAAHRQAEALQGTTIISITSTISKRLLLPAGEHQPVRGAGGGGAPCPGGGRAPPDPRHQAAAQLGHGPDALLHHTCHHGKQCGGFSHKM